MLSCLSQKLPQMLFAITLGPCINLPSTLLQNQIYCGKINRLHYLAYQYCSTVASE